MTDAVRGVSVTEEHEVTAIRPLSPLGAATGDAARSRLGAFDADAVARAEAALKTLSGQFGTWMENEVVKLEAAFEAVRSEGMKIQGDRLHLVVHDLKGLGGTYGFPIVTRIAGSLGAQIADTGHRAVASMGTIEAHVIAIRAAINSDVRDEHSPEGRALLASIGASAAA